MIQQQLFFEDFSVQVQKNIWKIEAYFCLQIPTFLESS